MSELQLGVTPTKIAAQKGLRVPRRYTKAGDDPYAAVAYERRTSVIREPDGTVVFEMKDVEVPSGWSQVAIDILAQKYFRKAGVPQYNEDGTPKRGADGSSVLGPERSVKQVVHRLAGCWRYWAERYSYFATPADAEAYYDEMVYMLLHQFASPNSPQWFNTGLNWAYGITGPSQGHYYVDPGTGVMTRSTDAYTHPQPHACVAGATRVLTNEGWLTMREIVVGERIDLSVFDGQGWAKILAVKNNGVRKVFRMMLANGQYVDLTDDHFVLSAPIRTKDGGYYSWVHAAQTIKQKVLFALKSEEFSLHASLNKEVVPVATDELVGFHVGDGYAGTYKKATHFGVATATDDEYAHVTNASERRKFEQQIGFVSKDKQEKLQRLNNEIHGKQKGAISEETVIAFEYQGEEEVFDIQTTSERFAANGVIVHNCFIQSIKDDLVNDGGIMDLWVREARIFKYGSGTGTNFSTLRGRGEPLSGGGKSSGLMSFLKIGDRSAGAIKSGGTTRRAAKMVCLDLDHPDIEEFINWKAQEEKKVAALIAGGYPADYEGEAYVTVSGQNSNNSVRVPNAFVKAYEEDGDWHLKWRTDGRVCKTVKARDLMQQVSYAAWACADPGVQYDTTINEWHTCPQSGRINASNPCSEYMFLDNTACNLASINLAHFFNPQTLTFDIDSFRHAVRLWTVTLEVSVLMAQFPSVEIAQMSYDFRTLGLGYANLGAGVLMVAGIPYDSPEARNIAAAITAIMTGESYATSAEMAEHLGTFPAYAKNTEDMLRVIRNHRRVAYNAAPSEYEKLEVAPVGLDPKHCPEALTMAARDCWDRALSLGEAHGYRNAQTTLLAPTGTIAIVMDCATTGVEPDFALVKFKKLAGGGYFKIVNEAVPTALQTLGYGPKEVEEIITYMKGAGTLKGAPQINHEALRAKGFTDGDLVNVEKNLPGVFELTFAFNVWTLGEETMQRLGFKEIEYNDFNFNMLRALGFASAEIEAANEYVCGAMTIEGAPHLKSEHYPVFDCANRCGKKGARFIDHMGHVKIMGAVQPFLSGAISKTINMPNEVTVEDVKEAYMESWRLGLKAVALYRDGCKLSQPLSTKSDKKKDEGTGVGVTSVGASADTGAALAATSTAPPAALPAPETVRDVPVYGVRRELPVKRAGLTIETKIGNQQVYLRTGEYPDGRLGEIFVDMFREGAAFRSLLNCFAVSISLGLQYGVPLEKFVEKFTFTRFEPSGFTTHPNVKMCTSVIDYLFRVLAMEYLGRTDFVQVPPGEGEARVHRGSAGPHDGAVTAKNGALGADVYELGQQAAFLPEANGAAGGAVSGAAGATSPAAPNRGGFVTGSDALLADMMGDAPTCDTCGHITVRNGSCYKCLNCGNSLGCS